MGAAGTGRKIMTTLYEDLQMVRVSRAQFVKYLSGETFREKVIEKN
jgi:hypothetical protein